MSGSLDRELTWREAGGDSLGLMRLSLALERSLGRKLTFDQLDPDMTATQLAQVLVQQTIAVPESNTARVHLVPGMLGDDPTFGDFRRSLVGVRTALVELPDLSCPSRVLRDIGETAAEVAKEIERQQPEGAILLGGCSFGGVVAYAVAQRLAAGGREIALLALLDPYVVHQAKSRDTLARRFKRAKSVLKSVLATPVVDWDAARRWLLDAFARLWPRQLLQMRSQIMKNLRLRAMKRWPHAAKGTDAARYQRRVGCVPNVALCCALGDRAFCPRLAYRNFQATRSFHRSRRAPGKAPSDSSPSCRSSCFTAAGRAGSGVAAHIFELAG